MSSKHVCLLVSLSEMLTFMISKSRIVYFIFGLLLFNFTILRPGDSPDANTGAQGGGLCTDCHDIWGTQTGSILLSGLPQFIQPSTAYPLTIDLVQTSPALDADDRAGFQLVILGSNADTSSSIGNFTSPRTNVAIDVASGNSNRVYLEHMDARLFS